MPEGQSSRRRPSYNVRIAPPKTKFGWFEGFIYRIKKNKEVNIARLYGLGGISAIIFGFVGLKKILNYDKEHNSRKPSVEELLGCGNTKNDEAVETHGDMPTFKPDYILRGAGEQGPEIRISEKDDCVEAAFTVPYLGMKATSKVPLDTCQFDDDGNIVLDNKGFPMLKGQGEFRNLWKERFNFLKLKFESLQIFK